MAEAPKLLYLVTEDWYFLSHRLPMARAARDAGFAVSVATRVADGGERIIAEGFNLVPLGWKRGIAAPGEIARSVAMVTRALRQLRPDVVHNVALKPILVAAIARRLAPPAQYVNAVTGLGSTLIETGTRPRLSGKLVKAVLPRALNSRDSLTIVQNESDADDLAGLGADRSMMVTIRGSGVDLDRHTVLPEPDGPITVGIASRMIEDKGIRPLIAAVRQVRAQGHDVRLLLAGDTDSENPTAIPRAELEALASEPGIVWLGHVDDVRTLWGRCHIAALPSRREGLPKALLEAAAAGRALIATDAPGCREVAIDGLNARLVPVDDADRMAQAILELARDHALRRRMGDASRKLVESDMSSAAVASATVAVYRRLLESRR